MLYFPPLSIGCDRTIGLNGIVEFNGTIEFDVIISSSGIVLSKFGTIGFNEIIEDNDTNGLERVQTISSNGSVKSNTRPQGQFNS